MDVDNFLGSSKLDLYTSLYLAIQPSYNVSIYAERLKNLWMPEEFFSYSRRAIVTAYARVAQVFAKLITHSW